VSKENVAVTQFQLVTSIDHVVGIDQRVCALHVLIVSSKTNVTARSIACVMTAKLQGHEHA
jgi:hypothetical protein